MPVVETIALICAIVSAFTGAAVLIPKGQDKATTKLDQSLTTGSRRVQEEYDRYSTPMFAIGDERGRYELQAVVNTLQQQLLQTLYALVGGSINNVSATYAALLSTSDSSRVRAITALAQQYQRLAALAPIVAPPSQYGSGVMSHLQQNRYPAIEAPSLASQYRWKGVTCDVCGCTIVGVRHKCNNCRNYDMCSDCFNSGLGGHMPNHHFSKLTLTN